LADDRGGERQDREAGANKESLHRELPPGWSYATGEEKFPGTAGC